MCSIQENIYAHDLASYWQERRIETAYTVQPATGDYETRTSEKDNIPVNRVHI